MAVKKLNLDNNSDKTKMNRLNAISHIVSEIQSRHKKGLDINVQAIAKKTSHLYKLENTPRLVEILAAVPDSRRKELTPLLKTKPVRTASGIAVVAVMCKPHRCPHVVNTGNVCVYCPGGPDSDFEYSTQSYTGYEPTSMRAIRARYDPFEQTTARIKQLKLLGHATDKVEFIILGGTFMSLPEDYRDYFVRNLHDALSGHSSSNVKEAVHYGEKSKTRCIGLTIETRPDYCLEPHIDTMLDYACTRVEVGVQSVFEDVARDTNRGHTVEAVCKCFCLLKDAGYKVIAHMMPDLPNADFERDLSGFKELFYNPKFRPDGVKIYPTLVIRKTGLYELWKTGAYKNYSPDTLVDLLARILSIVPPWVRIYRIQRDIPMSLVSSGVERGNIRELVALRMNDLGLRSRDLRTREVGIRQLSQSLGELEPELVRRDYVANEGWETFISYEDASKDTMLGLLRLRLPGAATYRNELKDKVSIVRELHVYGSAVPVHSKDPSKFQHQGFGTLLMHEAEKIAKNEHGSKKMSVISGVGTRNYYRKLGYHLDGPFMSKLL